jgi:di/tricarboxylate transporter
MVWAFEVVAPGLGLNAWITLAVTGLLLYGLIRDKPADVLFLGAVVLLALFRVITPKQAFAGFANEGMLTVAALFVVAAGLGETGLMEHVSDRLFGRVTTERAMLARLAVLLIPLSALLNNTPIVAIMVPIVIAWCRRHRVSPSRLLIPVSFLTILGGCCTLIGTSTNLVVQGLLEQNNMPRMSLLELGKAGVPCAIVGTLYLLTVGRRLLPDRKELIEQLGESRREYLVEMLVQPGCRLAGKNVADAGLRHLPGLFLIEIDRDGAIVAPVEPHETIQAGDRLVFTGVVTTIVDLEKVPGLVPAADATYELAPERRLGRRLCEAVISPTSPLVGRTVREADFRALYNAAVVAVHRNGARLTNKVGDIELRPGDTLLLQAGPNFARAYRNNPDFYLVSDVPGSRPLRREKARVAALIFAGLVAWMVLDTQNILIAAFLAAGLMVATRCISAAEARRSVEWPVLIAIGASFGVGTALEQSGVARMFAGGLVAATHALGPIAALAAIYIGVLVLTEIISNNAAAVIAFPFGVETAHLLGVHERPFVIAVALAASQAFASPIGYQTHMMVFGPGGYRFNDFVRIGVPLNVLMWAVAVAVIPFAWPFH